MVDLMATETRNAVRKFYGVQTVTTLPAIQLGLVIVWSSERATIFRRTDLDELMNDPKFVELLTIEHLNGE